MLEILTLVLLAILIGRGAERLMTWYEHRRCPHTLLGGGLCLVLIEVPAGVYSPDVEYLFECPYCGFMFRRTRGVLEGEGYALPESDGDTV